MHLFLWLFHYHTAAFRFAIASAGGMLEKPHEVTF